MNRTTRLILYFFFVFAFFFVWDYFVLRPKREALIKQKNRPKPQKVEKKEPKLSKPEIRYAPKLGHLKLNGYIYTVDLNNGAIFSLIDRKHKAEPSGYIIKPLRVDSQTVKIIGRGVLTDKFDINVVEDFRLKISLKDDIPFQITTPLSEYKGDGIGERKELFIKTKSNRVNKYSYKNSNINFRGDTLIWFGLRSRYYFVGIWDFEGSVVSFKDGNRITLRLYPKGDKEFYVFFGPAEKKLLSLKPSMKEVFDLGGGWATIIAWPIYWILMALGKLGNYGIAIILLALIIKLLTSPLSLNMYRASLKMQKLKPKLEKIQKLYKDDPERLQWETLKLYREAGFNPLGGCLPLLLQLPIFWALYQVLQNSIELKGAEFLFWIKDLSHKDPYYVLPIVMGGISLLNTYLSPGLDPNSKRTSMILSAVFVFIFLNFPAGIVLYWLVYSLFGIIEHRLYKLVWKH